MTDLTLAGRLDVDHLQAAQDAFARRTGLALITVNATGRPVTEPSRFTTFCAIMRSNPQQRKLCESCDAHGGLQAMLDGRPATYRCHTGLVDFSIPILQEGAYLGAVLCGQVRPDEVAAPPDLTGLQLGWRRDPHLVRIFDQIPKVAASQLESHTRDLADLVGDLLERHNLSVAHRYPSPSLRVAFHQPAGGGPSGLTDQPARALELATARHDLTAQAKSVNAALDALFRNNADRISPSLLQPLEDAVVAGGRGDAEVSEILRHEVMRSRAAQRIPLTRNQCHARLEKLLFMHHDESLRRAAGPHSFPDLLNYIERTISRPISLNQAADFLNVTAPHLSRTFKSRMGINFSDYVAAKRIERAKLLLQHTDLAVAKIARDLGFVPPNYFTRLFKQLTAKTPTEYRRATTAEKTP